ncbi:hypothetical protein CLV56_0914 [Mumia flava]|uniref:Uncharacterized protein n=1 Tax=Mumia flava TaxID=1348852 RepID=A0A0B2B7A2_9ACTN|nr:hypothetical protein [Mumia flava]PJJ56703.1 hypothetical protein CLV56_0914 [Mumia flava]
MRTLAKRAAAVLSGTALVVSGALVAASAPASAAPTADRPVDVTKIRATNGIATYKSTSINIAAARSVLSNVSYYSMKAGVYKGTRRLGTVTLYSSSGRGYLSFPTRWGRGTFRIKNVRISGNFDSTGNYERFNYVDTAPGGYFTVKSGIRASGGIKYRYGSTKKVARMKLTKFGTNGKWGAYKKKKVVLQYKKGGWKKVKKLRTNKKGKVRYSFRMAKRHKYRFVVKPAATVAGGKFPTSGKV